MPIFSHRVNQPRWARLAVFIGAVGVVAGCKDLTSVDASLTNVFDTTTVYAINGAPPGSPTAVNLFQGAFFRADQGFAYDVAFDIDDEGKALIIPSRALASQFSSPYPVGLQVVETPFDALTEAPRDGYARDTAVVVDVGDVVAIESHDPAICGFAIKGTSYFSKLVVTSIDPATRKLGLIVTINRNCGFRSFSPGIPKN